MGAISKTGAVLREAKHGVTKKCITCGVNQAVNNAKNKKFAGMCKACRAKEYGSRTNYIQAEAELDTLYEVPAGPPAPITRSIWGGHQSKVTTDPERHKLNLVIGK
jgi:hypothetical protein